MNQKFLFIFFITFLPIAIFAQQDTIQKITIRKKFTESDLFPSLCGQFQGDVSYQEIEECGEIKTKSKLKIHSFDLSLRFANGEKIYSSNSKRITSLMLDKIKNLNSGEMILFTNIKAFHPSGKLLKLQPLMLFLR